MPTNHGAAEPAYMTGFGNSFATEAVQDALPTGRNSPQHVAFGLYAEQISGSAFTTPRHENRHSWLYRIRPSAAHRPYRRCSNETLFRSGPFDPSPGEPNRLRWNPLPFPEAPADFVDGMTTFGGNGDPAAQAGVSIHLYTANKTMTTRVFHNADGEMLIVPQQGQLRLFTEMGLLDARPGDIAVIPRGIRFRVELPDGAARGYVCENHGAMFRLPELGPIGSNGLANGRDFLVPVAWFEDIDIPFRLVQKYHGRLWETELDHSPFDVVAWHGNLAPYKYDLANFNAINSVSFDHPDPSIFTVLTSPGEISGTANCDFAIFPPRWTVAEHTFRPPWFHRNVMSEFMGLVRGAYDAKVDGFIPGGASLHNCMSAHGPDKTSYVQAIAADLAPHKIENTLAFMFETRWAIQPTPFAMETPFLQTDYDDCWSGFAKAQVPFQSRKASR